MALIVPSGGLISQVNGTVDGKVYYRGRWGNVVRAWVNPTNTITLPRTNARIEFGALISLFNSLTPDMQDEWNDFANSLILYNRLAQPYIPTGLSVFISRNMNLAYIAESPILLPEPDQDLIAVTSIDINTWTAGALIFSSHVYPNLITVPVGYKLLIAASNNTSASISFLTNRYRNITYLLPGTPFSFYDMLAQWLLIWGNPATVGKKIFIKVQLINSSTGQACPPCYANSIIS